MRRIARSRIPYVAFTVCFFVVFAVPDTMLGKPAGEAANTDELKFMKPDGQYGAKNWTEAEIASVKRVVGKLAEAEREAVGKILWYRTSDESAVTYKNRQVEDSAIKRILIVGDASFPKKGSGTILVQGKVTVLGEAVPKDEWVIMYGIGMAFYYERKATLFETCMKNGST